ncbi:STAS domain-containing protein [Amycolatopsis orientalis]|uniref:STAS domain-containing protein n=1 Tax=Amycolatopsis orientalis TaxID=31958 RepID=UPI00039C42F0|nr:STAS domain-containing protein [Amycolatopsis orientalis]
MTLHLPGVTAPVELTVRATRQADTIHVALAGDLDAATAPVFAASVAPLTGPVVVDLSGVAFLSCAGVRALLEAHERIPEFTVVPGAAHAVRRCLSVTRADEILRVREAVAA